MNEKNKLPEKSAKPSPEKTLALAADFGKVYIKALPNGQIMAPIKADMTLFDGLGQIYKQQDKFLITATGYRYLNKVASISIVKPQTVIVDGRAVPNPHIERNPKTKAIESVNIRAMGIGYSPAGNIVVVDKTLFYNIYTYFIQAVQNKMKRVRWVKGQPTDEKLHPHCAVYGIADERPKMPGSWAFFETEPPLGLWINYEDQAIIDCLEEHTQRQRFGDRMATTIVERNILKDHPAIAASQVYAKQINGGVQATVTVHGYRNDNTTKNISEIMKQAESGEESKDFEIQAEVITGVDPEEEKAALKEVAADEKSDADEDAGPDLFKGKAGK